MAVINVLYRIAAEISATFVEMAPYLLLGLTFAGVLHVLFPKESVARHLGGNDLAGVAKASLFGVPLPLCSCGVVPTALSLRRSRASRGATVSFLISTPQTGVDSIIATAGMLGPVFAVFRPFAALFMGLVGGVATNILVKEEEPDAAVESGASCPLCNVTEPHAHGPGERVKKMAQYAYGDFLDDISLQLLLGIALSGLLSYFLPESFFTQHMPNEFAVMLLMVVGGIPLYVCATASIPIAASLMARGLSPGAAFVFLAVGPATNAATVTLIANAMGRKVIAVYLTVIASCSIIAGYGLNAIAAFTSNAGFRVAAGVYVHREHGIVIYLGTAVMGLLLILSLLRKAGLRIVHPGPGGGGGIGEAEEGVTVLGVDGMTCNHCASSVAGALRALEGVEEVDVNLKKGEARVRGRFSLEGARRVVACQGYSVREEDAIRPDGAA